MLNFKLNNNAIDSFSTTPLADYLKSLGITDTDQFLKMPHFESEICGAKLDNAVLLVHKLKQLFDADKKFFLIVDCDTDGFTSSAIFYNYFKQVYPHADIEWMLHEEKQHGIELDKIPADAEVIIVPDAGSNQIQELDHLNSLGKYVLVMDHHETSKDNKYGSFVTVVNNQTSDAFENKALSGAGVVFKIIQLFDAMCNYHYSSQYYDLAALGIIADCMDSRTLDNNYIIWRGLNNVRNKMFKALLDKQSFSVSSVEKPHKIDVAFYIAPLINGTIRMGTMEDKELLFRGFIEQDHTEFYPHEWRGSTTMEDFYHRSARIAYNVKNEQNRLKMKCLEFLQRKLENAGMQHNQIIIALTDESDEVQVPKTLTGLVAMELLRLYGKPSLVLRPVQDENGNLNYAGSGRSYNFEELPSFLQFVKEQDESVYAEGHACAFGASIRADELENFISACNEKMAHIDFSDNATFVDAIFNTDKLNPILIHEFASGERIYGNSIPQPLIAVQGIISSNDVRIMGKEASSVRITIKNIPFVKFKDAELAETLRNGSMFEISLVGKPALNDYQGAISSQVKIQEIDIKPITMQKRGLF